MTATRKLPRSLLWFLPVLCLIPLAFVPLPLFVLGFLLLVPTVALNAGFLSLGIEAWRARISRLWILAPAIWFGGYASLVVISNLEIARLDEQFRLANAGIKVAFDPTREDLVIIGGRTGNRYVGPDTLVQSFDLPVVYSREGQPQRHLAYRLGGGDTCQQYKNDRSRMVEYSSIYERRKPALDDLCLYALAENPANPAVTIEIKQRSVDDLYAPRWEIDALIVDSANERHILRSGITSELRWIPIPSVG